MSDTTNYDPVGIPTVRSSAALGPDPVEPERFDAPAAEHAAPPADPFASERLVPVEAIPAGPGLAAAPSLAMPGGADAALSGDGNGLRVGRLVEEAVAWFKTLASAAVYATLIVTFGFQVARVEGQSMAPTLADQDRLIVNKLAYRLGEPHVGDIVMLYYPLNPDKSFVKRVIAEEGDQVRVVDGRVYRNDVPMDDAFVPA